MFVLIGLSLHGVLARLGNQVVSLLPLAGCIILAVTVARIVWVFPGAYLPRVLPSVRRAEPTMPLAFPTIIAWSGMRGVVSLAAALALPDLFPGRDEILFATFAVIVVTVLVQGTTLGPLIRVLGVSRMADGTGDTDAEVRAALVQAELRVLEERAADPLDGAIARDVLNDVRSSLAWATAGATGGAVYAELQARLSIRLDALAARRAALFAVDRERHLPDSLLHALEHEIDLDELRLRRRQEPG